jgi:hypothetical protein
MNSAEYQTDRTIELVIDVENSEIINADDFFSQNEKIVSDARKVLELAYKSGQDKYQCAFCDQNIKISGRRLFERGITVYFFSHLQDSDDCPIKTTNLMSLSEILAKKYKGINEGELHKKLKNFIAGILNAEKSKIKGFSNIEIEKYVYDVRITNHWRRPDVRADFQNKKLVFELQLSTTFLSVVVARDAFYRLHNTYIIWIFGSFNHHQQKLMEKDLYYAHHRNVFVLDEKAQQLSNSQKQLILNCYWQLPKIIDGKVNIEWHNKMISVDELIFDDIKYEAFYYDSDKDFYHTYDHEEQNIINEWEKAKEQRWNKIFDNFHSKREKIEILYRLMSQKEADDIKVGTYYKGYGRNRKWGFKIENGIEIIAAKYSAVNLFSEGLAWVKNEYDSWGAINYEGAQIIPFEYNSVENFHNDLAIVGIEDGYNTYSFGCIDTKGKVIIPVEFEEIQNFREDRIIAKNKDWKWGCFDENGKVIIPFEYDEIQSIANGKVIAKYEDDGWGCKDEKGKTIIPFDYDTIRNFVGGNAIVEKDGNWGCFNVNGIKTVSCKYKQIDDFVECKAKVLDNNYKYGYIDDKGQIVVPCEYNEIKAIIDKKAIAKINGKWGYIDTDGRIIIPFIYDDIKTFNDGKTFAKMNGKWGYIDHHGKVIIPFVYDNCKDFIGEKANVQKKGKWGFIDIKGNSLIEEIVDLNKNLVKVKIYGKWGVETKDGKVIIPHECEYIDEFIEGKAEVKINWWRRSGHIDEWGKAFLEDIIEIKEGVFKGTKLGRWGLETNDGAVIVPFEYDEISELIDGKAKARKKSKWGVISEKGNIIIPFDFSVIEDFDAGRVKVSKSTDRNENLWGYLNEKGDTVIAIEFTDIQEFYKGKAKARKNGEWGLIDLFGNSLLEDAIEIKDGIIKGKRFGKWGIEKIDGMVVVPFEYSEIHEFVNEIAKAQKHGDISWHDDVEDYCFEKLWGVIDIKGKVVIPFNYLEIKDFVDGKALAQENEKGLWGVIDEKGRVIITFKYDQLKEFYNGKSIARKDGKVGVIDKRGNTIAQFEYTEIKNFVGGIAIAKKKERY